MTSDKAIEFIIELEGGYVDNPKDPGGETKFGISKKAFPNLDIKNLSVDEAKDIYKRLYWDSVQGDKLPHGLNLLVFDSAVQHGTNMAIRLLQRILKVKEDGALGPVTLEALQGIPTQELISQYTLARHKFYTGNPNWDYFSKGWAKRLLMVALMSAFFSKTNLLS